MFIRRYSKSQNSAARRLIAAGRGTLFFLLVQALFSQGAWAASQAPILQNIAGAFGNAPRVPYASIPVPVSPPVPVEDTYRSRGVPVGGDWSGYFEQLLPQVRPGGLRNSGNNRLELLVDGDQAFSALAGDIARARRFIHIKMFIWSPDETGYEIRDLLAARVKEGVRVRITLDFCGAYVFNPTGKMRELIRSMRDAGMEVKVAPFRPMHADHRKVFVMDDGEGGMTAYTGGMNIGIDYRRNWHDQLTRVTGPAAADLHLPFLEDWESLSGQVLSGFPSVEPIRNGASTYVLTHRGGDKAQNIKRAYMLAIRTARRSIRIEDPYFTDKDVIEAIIAAAKDPARPELRIQLIVPANNNHMLTLKAFRSYYPRLIKAGVEIYEYQTRMEHLKVAVMDHIWTTMGSSNLDAQSLKYNDELNLLVLDGDYARETEERIFDKDISESVRITSYKPGIVENIASHLPFLTPQIQVPAVGLSSY